MSTGIALHSQGCVLACAVERRRAPEEGLVSSIHTHLGGIRARRLRVARGSKEAFGGQHVVVELAGLLHGCVVDEAKAVVGVGVCGGGCGGVGVGWRREGRE